MSKDKNIFYSDVVNGKLQKNTSAKIVQCLKLYNGKRIQVTIEKLSSKRSTRQNAYWWVLMAIIANETGHTKETVHDECKKMFLAEPIEWINKKTGEIHPGQKYGSSTTLNKDQFSELIDKLQFWAADFLGIVLPDPEEQTTIEWN